MDLDEYLWRNKIRQKDFCKKIQIQAHTLSLLVRKKHTPRLSIAINIHTVTKGQVEFKELLRPEDLELLID
jgi:DNA-binding XRE family transcriptional regulator